MFPPAELPLDEALADHEAALASDAAWLVKRFVCRASSLAALPPHTPHRLSVVIDVPWSARPPLHDERIEAIELPPPTDLAALAAAAPEVYVELPPGADLATIAALGLRAKIRCGGATVPTVEELAAFVGECKRLGLPFKATAGLHHAVRTGAAHGFLNVLAAAVFDDEAAALAEDDAAAFTLAPEGFGWRDRHASAAEISAARRNLFTSIGSCSFTEPVDELRALGAL